MNATESKKNFVDQFAVDVDVNIDTNVALLKTDSALPAATSPATTTMSISWSKILARTRVRVNMLRDRFVPNCLNEKIAFYCQE